jgi:hypothetical protein
MQQDQTEKLENPATSATRHKPTYVYPLLGLLAGCLLCGVPLLFLVFSGLLDRSLADF